MTQKSQAQRQGDVTIDTNWIIMIGMALLFAFTAFLLGLSIRDVLLNKVDLRISQSVPNGWIDTFAYVLGAVYCFLFAYSFQARHVKIAFVLLGTKYLVLLAVLHFHAGADVWHFSTIAGSIASQIAYAIILFAIARWFRTVVRRSPPGNYGVSGS